MASCHNVGPNQWAVYLESKKISEVIVKVHMSQETAQKLTTREAGLSPKADDLTIASVVMGILHNRVAGA